MTIKVNAVTGSIPSDIDINRLAAQKLNFLLYAGILGFSRATSQIIMPEIMTTQPSKPKTK
ncbi:hypothetical protein D3C87_1869640 [compost metagenome]